jgi:hypothetical protein
MKIVLLSFDIEEFDMPFEYGKIIGFKDQIQISAEGTKIILDILKELKIHATFFSTVIFAREAPALIARIKSEGHELCSHGYFHSNFRDEDLLRSKIALEEISGDPIKGFRMPRMKPVNYDSIRSAGYEYDSSLNPTYLPGRYNNFSKPRKSFVSNGIVNVPASTVPIVRLPLFWLSFHNLPLWLYKLAALFTINIDGCLNLYFHPWEFQDIHRKEFGLPNYVSRNCEKKMTKRFTQLLLWMKRKEFKFFTIHDFVDLKHRRV